MKIKDECIIFNGFQNSKLVLERLMEEMKRVYPYDFLHLTTAVRLYGLEYATTLVAYNICFKLSHLLDSIHYLTDRIHNHDYAEQGTIEIYIMDELYELTEPLEELYKTLINEITDGLASVFFTINISKNIQENDSLKIDGNVEKMVMYFKALRMIYLKKINPIDKSEFFTAKSPKIKILK